MAKPTDLELELVKEVRERIEDLELKDEFLQAKNLVRFVRARNGNMNQIEDMIRKNVRYIEDMDIDSILSWEPPCKFPENFPWAHVGYDDKGGPLCTILFGRWNPSAMSGQKDEFQRLCIQYIETVWADMKCRSKGKEAIPQFTAILDFDGLSWKHYSNMEFVQGILTIVRYFEANYPDTLRLAVIVNAPYVFTLFWKLISPLTSEATHAKLKFLGTDRKLWKQTLCQYAKIDQIPKYYGGNLPDNHHISFEPSGMCKYIVENGNDIQVR